MREGGWWPDGFRCEIQNGWFSGGWSMKPWAQGCVCMIGHHMTPTHKQRPGGAARQRSRTHINTKQKADKHKNPTTHTNTHAMSYTTMWFHIWNSSMNTCMLQKIHKHKPIYRHTQSFCIVCMPLFKIDFCKNASNPSKSESKNLC